jgi:hypothetical protein
VDTIGPGEIDHHQDWPEQLTGTLSDKERLAKAKSKVSEVLDRVRYARITLLDDQGEELLQVEMSPVHAGDTITYAVPTGVSDG